MRQSQQKNRMRGRGRKGPNPLSRTFESNGPDVKIRGTASHVAEKYSSLARDALSSGDNVMAENYFQHAEHYYRIVAAAAAQSGRPEDGLGRGPQPEFGAFGGSDDDGDEDGYDQPRQEGFRGDYPRHDNRHDNPRHDNRRDEYPRQEGQRHDNPRQEGHRPDRQEGQRHERRDEQRGDYQRPERQRPERQHQAEPASEPQAEAEQAPRAPRAEEAHQRAEGGEPRPRSENRNRRRPRNQDGERANGVNGGHEADEQNGARPARAERAGVSSDASMLPDSILGRPTGPVIGADD